MIRPPLILRKEYKTEFNDKSVFAANARLLQSIWRHEKGIPLKRTFGNFLSTEQAYCNQLNFLTPKIREVVREEVEQNERKTGPERKVIKRDRLYENLLASQPLAFNLFAELIAPDYELANRVFTKLYSDQIKKITSIEFEISLGRGDIKYTGDRSAFDVFICYEGHKGAGFIGIEIKYSEALLDTPASFKERYREVAIQSGKFAEDGIAELCKMPVSLEQIWRDHLLSLSMLPPVNPDFDEGFFVYLFPGQNEECVNALDRYFRLLKSHDQREVGLHILLMEDFLDALKIESNEKWIRDFEDRYLRFEKIDSYIDNFTGHERTK